MTMTKAKAILNPELAKYIRESFPVVKKRSALWFFNNEFKNDLIETSPTYNAISQSPPPKVSQMPDSKSNQSTRRVSKMVVGRNRILQMWKNMDPESKRKYFNMAEFDNVRFKEQKSLWISEVGALLQKHRDIGRVISMAPTHDELQSDFLDSLEKLHKNYEQMIQTESTKEIYKDAIRRAESGSMDADEIISAVPKHHDAILVKPRRPPAAFVLYLNDNMSRYTRIRRETKTKNSCMRLCANEWATIDEETKRIYEERYLKLKQEYDKAMEKYKAEIQDTSDSYLQEASREKKAFRKSLRKRLRDSSVLPLSIRNAFNFFMMENKECRLSDATKTWRDLPLDQKMKYIKMNEEDAKRYNREIEAFNEIKQSLSEMIAPKTSSSSSK